MIAARPVGPAARNVMAIAYQTAGLPFACSGIPQVPRRAHITGIGVQNGSRFDLAHVCRPKCVLLRTKCCFWPAVCSPMRPEPQGSNVAPSTGASRRVVPSAHASILPGIGHPPCQGGDPGASDPGCVAKEVPRRAMIRRRGKRGRTWRAEAPEAYEARTQLTNGARTCTSWGLPSGAACAGCSGGLLFAPASAYHLIPANGLVNSSSRPCQILGIGPNRLLGRN